MKRARQASLIGSLAMIVVATAALVFLMSNESAKAQFGQSSSGGSSVNLTYSTRYINKVIPTRTNDRVIKVTPFPDSPVFFVELKKSLNVWVRTEKGLRLLREISLENQALQELVFLDDNRTFILQATESARVFSIDRTYTEVAEEK